MSPIASFSSLLPGSCTVLCSMGHVTAPLSPHPCIEQDLLDSGTTWMEELSFTELPAPLCGSQDTAGDVTVPAPSPL